MLEAVGKPVRSSLPKIGTKYPVLAKELIGKTLVTHQTGPKGRKVRRLLIEETAGIAKELYLRLLVVRDTGSPTFIASTEGGMEIEEVGVQAPDKDLWEAIDPSVGYQGYNGQNLAFGLGLPQLEPAVVKPFLQMLENLYRLFMEKNASLIAINPLVSATDKRLIALDGKVSIDDNSLFKFVDVQTFRDLHEEEPLEIEATNNNLNHVVGFFINIFGGIVQCERIAHGVIDAAKEVGINLPLMVQGITGKEGSLHAAHV